MDRYPVTDDTQPELELWDPDAIEQTSFERTSPARTGTRIGGRIARSLPGAAAGTLIVAAIAFGAVLRPTLSTPQGAGGDAGRSGLEADGYEPDGNDGGTIADIDGDHEVEVTPTEDVDGDGAVEPADGTYEPTDASDEPTPIEPAEPTVESIDLALHLQDGYVKVDWSACDVDGFRYYKVVRSADERPTWPLGEGDKLIAAVEDAATTVIADGELPLGTKLFYRVFALAERDGGMHVACQSPVRGLAVPAATPKPEPKPEPEPTDKPSAWLALSVSIKEGKPYVDWSECQGDFHYYKVVRSTDQAVTWPKGGNDSLVAAVGPDGKTAVWDGEATPGKKVWYRVFCLRETEGGYKVLASSPVKGIAVPADKPDPEPDPVALGLEVNLTDGGVKLRWEACGSESFVAYKVVRSAGSNPSYLPGTDGSHVIAVIENAGVTSFVDGGVEAGQTWYYRVQAIGYMNGHKILLGQTAAIAVTVE
jgi:hypothetical protein